MTVIDGVAPLSDEQVARYHAEGWLHLGAILTPDEVAELLAEERRFRPRRAYGGRDNPTLLVSVQLCDRSEPIRRFATQGRHLPLVAQLMGPNVCLTHQQFLAKLPDDERTRSDIPWHQDNGYGTLEPMTDLTVWVALTDTDERNGCVWIVPGSHRDGLLDHGRADVNPYLRETGREPEGAVPAVLRAGEAVAFTGLTVHGSGPNRSDRERVGGYLRYCEPHARMVTEGGRPVLDDPHSWMVLGEA